MTFVSTFLVKEGGVRGVGERESDKTGVPGWLGNAYMQRESTHSSARARPRARAPNGRPSQRRFRAGRITFGLRDAPRPRMYSEVEYSLSTSPGRLVPSKSTVGSLKLFSKGQGDNRNQADAPRETAGNE